MATRTVSRNNLIAGSFVLAGIVLAVVMSIVISGAQERLIPTRRYIIRFPLATGTNGLKQGSSILLGGQPVGRVTGVQFRRPGGAATPPQGVDILVKIRSDLLLYENATALLERPLLGNLSSINIASVGDPAQVASPRNGSPELQQNEDLQGVVAPPSFLAQAGYGPEQIQQVQAIISDAEAFVRKLTEMADKLDAQLDPTMAGIRTSVEDVNAVTSEVRQRTPEWTSRVDAILARTEEASGRFNDTVTNINEMVDEVQATIAENRPHVENFVTNIEAAAQRINDESVPLLNEALASGRAGADEFATAGRTFNTLLQEQLPTIRRTLANLRLAADQAKLTMVEVRRSPWRLFYQPGAKELESELFFDAARTYAEAVSDLRAASESLEAVSKVPGDTVNREEAQRLNDRLQEAFEKYRGAEQRLLDEMIEKRR
jgi:ABC-type transporter Mla subunit MlaD